MLGIRRMRRRTPWELSRVGRLLLLGSCVSRLRRTWSRSRARLAGVCHLLLLLRIASLGVLWLRLPLSGVWHRCRPEATVSLLRLRSWRWSAADGVPSLSWHPVWARLLLRVLGPLLMTALVRLVKHLVVSRLCDLELFVQAAQIL